MAGEQLGKTESAEPSGAAEVLRGLLKLEVALDSQLERARQRTQEILDSTRRETDRMREEAKVKLAAEVESLRQAGAGDLEAALEAMRGESELRIGALRRKAEANRDRAVAFILLRVTGREAP
jgi:F0F1-type ATP synthase membrane subunit b/b'